jgi:demethylmenaquinone methyltransferase/2-methoxy-6-polyprenyl-1,4-benzoquinol methylase
MARVVARGRHTPELWSYYWDTIEACVPPETVMAALHNAGFVQVQRHVELGIFSEYTASRPA